MWCVKCNHHVGQCTCPDIKERLESFRNSPYLKLTYCDKCGEYIARCKCEKEEKAPDVR